MLLDELVRQARSRDPLLDNELDASQGVITQEPER